MALRIVVVGDIVSGTDQHHVSGTRGSSSAEGTFAYRFSGKVEEKDGGNDFVRIHDKSIITAGNNKCPQQTNHVATSPSEPPDFTIVAFSPDQPDNNGSNSSGSGSTFVTISGSAVILDGDDFDTCDFRNETNMGRSTNSKVAALGQDFVVVSEE